MWGFDANLSPSVLFCFKSIIFLLTFFMWSWRLCTLSCVVELLGSTKRLNINYQDPDGWVIVLLWVNLIRTCPGQDTGSVSEHFHSIFFILTLYLSHSLTFPESVSVIVFMHVDFLCDVSWLVLKLTGTSFCEVVESHQHICGTVLS